jgi:hypothetical protein
MQTPYEVVFLVLQHACLKVACYHEINYFRVKTNDNMFL